MCFLSGSSTRITFSPFFKSIRAGLPFWRHPRRCCCCTDLLQGQKAFLLVACRYADSQPCSWTSHRALGEFCESGGLRKSDHKSRSPILSVWCLHRGTRAVASGDVLLRICTEYTAADCHADLLSAFQKKGISASVLHDRLSSGAKSCLGRWTMVTETPISARFSAISRPIKPPPAKTAVFGF